MGNQSRERVVGNLRASGRDRRNQSGLAGIWKTDDRHVRQELEVDRQTPRLTGQPFLGEARGLPDRRREVLIPPTPAAAFGKKHALARTHEVGNALARVGVGDHGTQRKAHRHVLPRRAMPVGALAVLSPTGAELGLMAKMVEGVLGRIRNRPDGSTVAAVTAGGTTAGNEFLAPKCDTTMTAVSALDADLGAIDEHVKKLSVIRCQFSVCGGSKSLTRVKLKTENGKRRTCSSEATARARSR